MLAPRVLKNFKVLASVLALLSATFSLPNSASASSKVTTYKQIWSDEFSGKKGALPNSKYWGYDLGGLNQNGELQFYTKSNQNIALDGAGKLVITANRIADQSMIPVSKDPVIEKMLNACISCQFSSSRIKSAGKISVQYGRIEARIKVPSGEGTWPAFWMLGSDLLKGVPWPDAGEIDVIETKGSVINTAFGTIHGPGMPNAGAGLGSTYTHTGLLSSGFHIYAIEWQKNKIDFYVDDEMYFSVSPTDQGAGKWVYNQPFFMILNLAMGGEFGGEIDPNLNKAQLVVDYIRIYAVNGVGKVFQR
jgi:beta-glucanase (GH16 family)